MLIEIEDLDCNRCADVQLNRCVNSGLLQGCFPKLDVFDADFHFLSLFLQTVCVVCVMRSRA
jgi:hypothetical protein